MKVSVIGAGVGGLAVAIRLANAGHQVTVFERSTSVGGFCQGYQRDGWRFDTGPSLLVWPEQLAALFCQTGPPLHQVLPLTPVPAPSYRFADVTGGQLSAGELSGGGEWLALLDRAELIWQAVAEAVLSHPAPGPVDLARLALRRPSDLLRVAPGRTLRQLGRRTLTDPRLRLILDRYATYAGADPRRAPAVLAVIPYLEQRFGCWHVPGGLARIPPALVDRLHECGGQLRLAAPVVRIEHSDGAVCGLRLADGEAVTSDVVVSNVAELVTAELLGRPPGAPTALSFSGFSLLLGLQTDPQLPPHLVSFPRDYDAEFDAVFAGRPASDPAIYLCTPQDPAMHPAGGRSCRLLVNAPTQGRCDWAAPGLAERYGEHLLDRLASRGLDLRPLTSWWEPRTPVDLASASGVASGAIYGRAAHGLAGLRRPGNRTRLRGLYLVGGSVHPGGGLPLVLASAAIVAALVGPP